MIIGIAVEAGFPAIQWGTHRGPQCPLRMESRDGEEGRCDGGLSRREKWKESLKEHEKTRACGAKFLLAEEGSIRLTAEKYWSTRLQAMLSTWLVPSKKIDGGT